MLKNTIIIKDGIFRRYIYAYLVTQINIWIIPTLTPILLSNYFGIGKEFAFGLALQWLPSILMGPIIAILIKRWGAKKIYIFAMFLYLIVLLLLAGVSSAVYIQFLIFGLGICQSFASPSSLTLRAYVIPKGQEVAGNSIIIGIQRLAKIIGPLVAGVLILSVGVEKSFLISAGLCLPSIIALWAIPIYKENTFKQRKKNERRKITHFFKSLFQSIFKDRLLLGLFVTAIGYTITLGALKIYLFTLADVLGDAEQIYSFLLASQGLGAFVGAIFSHKIILGLQKKLTLAKIYAAVSILEGLILTLINISYNLTFIMIILIIASVFETLAFVTYFTLLQKRIPKEKQGVFNSITMPIIDSSYLIGVMLIGLIVDKYPLSSILYLIASFTIVTVVIFIKTFFQEKEIPFYDETKVSI